MIVMDRDLRDLLWWGMDDDMFWSQGIRFQCQGSGKCCVSHGDYGHVYLTLKDRRRIAEHLGMKVSAFTRKYCDRKFGVWKLRDIQSGDCTFLSGKRCSIYSARPSQCRTWPFWPELMDAKTWAADVKSFCPGVDRGRLWSKEEVEEQLRRQKQSETEYGT
jgi:Fe-S-cluster containining protein